MAGFADLPVAAVSVVALAAVAAPVEQALGVRVAVFERRALVQRPAHVAVALVALDAAAHGTAVGIANAGAASRGAAAAVALRCCNETMLPIPTPTGRTPKAPKQNAGLWIFRWRVRFPAELPAV